MEEKDRKYNIPIAEQEHKELPLPDELSEFLSSDEWQGVSVEENFLDFTEPYIPPRYTLRRGDVPFANVGDLHIISGKPGHGKTGLMTMLMSAILSGKYGKIEYALSKERPNPIVMYIDTEQSKDDTIAIKNRVCVMAGLDYKIKHNNFVVLRLREVETAFERWQKILKAIYIVRPTDIFLDGMLDIVKDFNDQAECQPIIRKSMMLATKYDASLWIVLHENPMINKLVGTLGSIIQRKVTEIFSVVKIKQVDLKPQERDSTMPPIYFMVNQEKARGKDIGRWFFQFAVKDSGWGIPEEVEKPDTIDITEEKMPQEPSSDDVLNMVSPIGTDKDVSLTALRERIKKRFSIGSTKATEYIYRAVKLGYLIDNNKLYSPNPIDLFHESDNEIVF